MRIVTWNLNQRVGDAVWNALLKLEPDIALLSEVNPNSIPEEMLRKSGYESQFEQATKKDGTCQRFKTGMIVKGEIGESFELLADKEWINQGLQKYSGNFVSREVRLPDHPTYNVISVHMPSWQFPHWDFTNEDVSGVMLPNYDEMYMSELLWFALKNTMHKPHGIFIIGGDFNTSEFIGSTKKRRAANCEAIRRICNLGFIEAVRHCHGRPIPSYLHNKGKKRLMHQLDHLYLPQEMREQVTSFVGDTKTYFGVDTDEIETCSKPKLSDHLPIIADIKVCR